MIIFFMLRALVQMFCVVLALLVVFLLIAGYIKHDPVAFLMAFPAGEIARRGFIAMDEDPYE